MIRECCVIERAHALALAALLRALYALNAPLRSLPSLHLVADLDAFALEQRKVPEPAGRNSEGV